jgi:TPP-dependent 2-oxoacid decarboxylase
LATTSRTWKQYPRDTAFVRGSPSATACAGRYPRPIDLPIYEARDFLAPGFYASLGFAVPAAIGAQLAQPDERPLVLVGDGAFQMTGMELSTCARYGLDPIVIVLNNGGYTTERLIIDGAFNDIQRWDYSKLPEVIGAGRAHRVETVGDLDRALVDARRRDGQFVLLDVRLDKLDVSPALRRLGASLQEAATQGQATGDG